MASLAAAVKTIAELEIEAALLVAEVLERLDLDEDSTLRRSVTVRSGRFAPLGRRFADRSYEMAAYLVCTYGQPGSIKRQAGTDEFLLLADGRLMPAGQLGPVMSVHEYVDRVRRAEALPDSARKWRDLVEPYSMAGLGRFMTALRHLGGQAA